MNVSPQHTWSLAALLLAGGVALAACGGDDQTADAGSSEAAIADSDGSAAAGTSAEATGSAPVDSSGSDYLGSYTLADDEFGTMVTVTVDGSTRTIETNALPDHETGEFPNDGNPNTISAQDLTWEYPIEAVYTGEATEVRTSGVAVNGVKFEPGTAETLTCSSGETYRIEALQDIYNLGLDFNNAHVQPGGEYHYHGISELLVGAYETDSDLVHIGFAADGHLMYYSKSGAYESGYALDDEARSGTDCVASGPDGTTIDVDGTAADGTYTSDWVYDESNGDLDSCNGTTVDGQYVYIVTDEYPYISRCLMGEVAAGPGVGGPPGGGEDAGAPAGGDQQAAGQPAAGSAGGQQGAAPAGAPDLSEAAATLGVTEEELIDALGPPPGDIEAAAEALGVSADDLRAALPAPGQ